MPGLAGRRRKPTSLRIVDGNRGRRPLPKAEPKPKRGTPPRPAHIAKNKIAAAEWKRLVAITSAPQTGVLTVDDGPILEATVLAYTTFRDATSDISDGLTYEVKTKAGGIMIRAKPQVAIASDAWRRYVAGLTHFGLSPAARGKVSAISSDEKETDPAEEFLGR